MGKVVLWDVVILGPSQYGEGEDFSPRTSPSLGRYSQALDYEAPVLQGSGSEP